MKRRTKRKVIMPFRVKRKIIAFLIAMSIILGNLYVPAGVVNAATPVRVGIDNQIPNVYITDENGNPLGASVDAVTGEYLYFYLSPQDETQYEIDNTVQQISVTEIETANSFIGKLIYQTGAKRPYYKYLVTDAVTLRFEEAWSIPLVTPVEQIPVEKEIQINNQIANTYLKDVNGNDVGSSIKAIPGEIVKFYLEPAAGYTSNGSAAFHIWENSSTNISAPLQRDGQNRYYLSYTVSDTVVALTFVEDGTMFSEPVSAAQYKLTFSIEEGLEAYACAVTNGVVSVYTTKLANQVTVTEGEDYWFAVKEASGYIRDNLTVTGSAGTSVNGVKDGYTLICIPAVNQNATITVSGVREIAPTEHKVTITTIEGLELSPISASDILPGVIVLTGTEDYIYKVKLSDGYRFDSFQVSAAPANGTVEVIGSTATERTIKISGVTSDITVAASGVIPNAPLGTQTFRAYLPGNMTGVSFSGASTIDEGDTYTLTAKVEDGYSIEGVTVKVNGFVINPTPTPALNEYIYIINDVSENLVFTAEGIPSIQNHTVLFGNNIEGAVITDEDGNEITKIVDVPYGTYITFVVKPKEGAILPSYIVTDDGTNTVDPYQYKDGAIYYHYRVEADSLLAIGQAVQEVSYIENDVTIYVPEGLSVTPTLNGIVQAPIEGITGTASGVISVPYGNSLSFTVEIIDTDTYKIAASGLSVTSNVGSIFAAQQNVQYVVNDVKQPIAVAIDGIEKINRTLTFVKGEGISITDGLTLGELTIVDTVREGDFYVFNINALPGYELDPETIKVEGDGALLLSFDQTTGVGAVKIGEKDVVVRVSGTKPTLESQTFNVTIPASEPWVSFYGLPTVTGGDTYTLKAILKEGYEISGMTVRCNGRILTPVEQTSGEYIYEVSNVTEDLIFSAEGIANLLSYNVLLGNNVEGAIITDLDGNQITKFENITYGEVITFVVKPEKEGTTLPANVDAIDQNNDTVIVYQYKDGAIYYHYYVLEESLITIGEADDKVDTISNEVTIYVPKGLKVTLLGDGILTGQEIDASSANVIETIDVPYGTNVSFAVAVGDTDNYKIAEAGLIVTSSAGIIEEKQPNTQYVLNNVKQQISIAIDGVESLARTVTFVKGEGISVTDGSNELTIVDTVKEGDYYEFTIKPTTGFELDPETLTVEGEGAHLTSVSKYLATGVVYVGKTDAVVTIEGTKPALYTLTFKVSIPEDADGVTYTGIGTPGGVLTVQGDGTYELTATLKDGYVIDGLIIKCNGTVVPPVEKSAGVYTYTIEHVAGDLVFTAEGAPKKEYFNIMFENKLAGTTVTNEAGEDISYLKNIAYGSLITFCLKVTEDGTVLPDKSDITMNVINESGILGEIVNYNTVSGVYVITYRVTQDVTIDINSVNPVGIVSNKVRAFVQPGLTAAFSDVFVDGAAAAGKNILNGQIGIQEVGEVNYGKDLNIVVDLDTVNYKYGEAGIVVTLTDGSYEIIELDKNTSFTVKNITGPVTLSITGAVKLKDYSINLPTIAAADYQYAQKAGVNVTSVKEGESYQFKVVTNAAYSDSIIETTANLPLNIVANNGNTVTYKIEKVTEDVVVTAAVQDKVVVDDTNGALNDFDLFTFDEDVTPENQQSLSQNRFLYVPTETAVTYAVRVNNPEAFGNDVPNITYTDATHSTPTAVKLYKSEEGVYSFTITTTGNAVIYTGDRLQPNEYTVIADDHNPVISDAAIQVEGVNLNDTNNKVTHGEKFTFSLNVSDPYDPDKFVVKANGVELRKTPAGTYVIANVTENQIISISEPVKKVYKVELRSDSKGIVYTDLTGNEITSGSYKDSNGNKIVSAEVPYGEDFNFKLIKEQNYLSSKVTLTDSLNGILTENSDGTYTVSAVTEARVITMESLDKVVVYLPLNILAGNVTPYYLEAYSDKSSNITVSELATENNKLTFYVKSGKRFRLDVEMPEGYNKSDVNATFNDTAMERYSVPGIPIIPNEYFLNHDLDTVGNSYHFFSVSVVEGSSVVSVNSVAMNTYNVTLPNETGIEINQMMGYDKDRVEYGSSYKFTITKDFGYTQSELKVTVGRNQIVDSRLNNVVWTTVIVPDANGVYTIPDIKENRYVKIEGIKRNVYTVTYPDVKGIKLKAIYNYDTNKYYNKNYVLHGDDFKFTATLEKAYSKSRFVVKVDKKVLKPDKNGVYTIKNITDFKKIVITGVRLDVKIVADDNTLKPGQSTHVEVINVPKGSSVKLHNDTPNIAVLDSEGNLYALKGGIVKLIAVTREYGEDVYTVKRIRVTKGHYHKDKGTKKVNGLNYKITKKATAKKAGEVEVSLNRYNKDLASDLVIPNYVRISGKKYRVTGIGAGAFYGDSRLRSVSIPESVLRISSSAFVKCRNLTEFMVNSKNHHYAGNGPMLTTGRGTKGTKLIAYPSASGKVKIGAGIANIGAYALSGTTVEELIVERCVVFIDMCAFSHMKKLKKLTFQSKNAKAIECSCILRNVNGCLKVYVPKSAYKAYKAILKEPKGSMTKTVRIYKK